MGAHRGNRRLNAEIERLIQSWNGTPFGQQLETMYRNGSSYESICEAAGIDYAKFAESRSQGQEANTYSYRITFNVPETPLVESIVFDRLEDFRQLIRSWAAYCEERGIDPECLTEIERID